MKPSQTRDLSVKEVASQLGVSTKFVRQLISHGELVAYRPGVRSYRVTQEAIEQYKAARLHQLRNELFVAGGGE